MSIKIIGTVLFFFVCILGYWILSPLFINKVVHEEFPLVNSVEKKDEDIESDPKSIASGNFVGSDDVHRAKGKVTIYEIDGKKILRFEDGFEVTNGPDLYVGFGKNGVYAKGSELARLKGNIGAQNYEIPDTLTLGAYDSVYIWCKVFSVSFAKSDLVYKEKIDSFPSKLLSPVSAESGQKAKWVPAVSCFVGGCSGQICSDQKDIVSTCEYSERYACYKTATCERQKTGACGWTETSALVACLGAK